MCARRKTIIDAASRRVGERVVCNEIIIIIIILLYTFVVLLQII